MDGFVKVFLLQHFFLKNIPVLNWTMRLKFLRFLFAAGVKEHFLIFISVTSSRKRVGLAEIQEFQIRVSRRHWKLVMFRYVEYVRKTVQR